MNKNIIFLLIILSLAACGRNGPPQAPNGAIVVPKPPQVWQANSLDIWKMPDPTDEWNK